MIDLLSQFSPLVGILLGWRRQGLLWYYLWFCFLCDVAAEIEVYFSLPKYHANIFLLAEFILIGSYFTKNIFKERRHQVLCFSGVLLLSLFFIGSSAKQGFYTPNYTNAAVFYVIYIAFCMVSLRKVLNEIEHIKLEKSPMFIFSAMFLVYASGTFLMLLFKLKLSASVQHQMIALWDVHNVLNMLKNLSIARAVTLSLRLNQNVR